MNHTKILDNDHNSDPNFQVMVNNSKPLTSSPRARVSLIPHARDTENKMSLGALDAAKQMTNHDRCFCSTPDLSTCYQLNFPHGCFFIEQKAKSLFEQQSLAWAKHRSPNISDLIELVAAKRPSDKKPVSTMV